MNAVPPMIGDPAYITYFELEQILDNDATFAKEALDILKGDYVDSKSTYTTASSSGALLNKWVERKELTCIRPDGELVENFAAYIYSEEGLEVVERGWLIKRADFVQLVEKYEMTPPAAFSPVTSAEAKAEPVAVERNRIINAFMLHKDKHQNKRLWDDKLSRPPEYLKGAMVRKGRPGVSTLWDPVKVAHALFEKGMLPIDRLDHAMKNFPECEATWRDQTELER